MHVPRWEQLGYHVYTDPVEVFVDAFRKVLEADCASADICSGNQVIATLHHDARIDRFRSLARR
jgi:hypothetical protein